MYVQVTWNRTRRMCESQRGEKAKSWIYKFVGSYFIGNKFEDLINNGKAMGK